MSARPISTTPTQYLTFSVHGEEYAVEILRVREVMEALPVTRVPSAPAAIRGVVSVRGAVVPIVDLGVRFGFAELELTRWTCIVVVELTIQGAPVSMGLLVDKVSQVVDLDQTQIEPVPPFGVPVRLEFLRGMGAVGAKFAMLLDLEHVVSPSDLLAAASAGASSAGLEEPVASHPPAVGGAAP